MRLPTYKNRRPDEFSGFTLIELLLVVTISALMANIGYFRYHDFNQTQIIKSAGLNLKNNLRFIQGKAITGVKPTSCAVSLDGYRITFYIDAGRHKYRSEAVCNGSIVAGTASTYELPPQAFFNTPNPAVNPTLQFNVVDRGITGINSVEIRNSESNKYYTLCISPSGDITDCGYATSPTACVCT